MLCYVISLNEPTRLFRELRARGLAPLWVAGINGRTCSPEQIEQHIHPSYARIAPKSAMGCAMSHLKAWQMLLDSTLDEVIIFEEDVLLGDDFITEYCAARAQLPADYDLFHLGYFGSQFFKSVMGVLRLTRPERVINTRIKIPAVALGSHGYVLSRRGAQKLIDRLDGNIFNHVDLCIQWLSVRGEIQVYCAEPRLAFQTSSKSRTLSSNASSVHPDLLNGILSHIHVDRGVLMSWVLSISLVRIQNTNLSLMSVCFLVLSIVLVRLGVGLAGLILLYALISVVELVELDRARGRVLVLHFVLFLLPLVVHRLGRCLRPRKII